MSGAADRRKLRLKNKEARKDKALEDLEKRKLFKSDPLKGFYEPLVNLISSPQNMLHISLHPILDVNPAFNDTYFAGKIDQFCPS